jgi:putative transposase
LRLFSTPSHALNQESITPPRSNAFIESFNEKFRDECLNQNWFVSLDDARRIIEAWRVDYNTVRPHSSLGHPTPAEFAAQSGGEKDSEPSPEC